MRSLHLNKKDAVLLGKWRKLTKGDQTAEAAVSANI